MTEAWLECIHNDRRFLVGGLLRNLSNGEELEKFRDLVAKDVLNQPTDMKHARERFHDKDAHRSDMTAVSRLFRVSIELAVFLSGKLV